LVVAQRNVGLLQFWRLSSETVMFHLSAKSLVDLVLAPDTPQAHDDSGNAREESHVISTLVTSQAVRTVSLAVGGNNRVLIINAAVD
jgi:hypothetical protein